MIFQYIDESGTGLKDTRSRYFVLASVGVHEKNWAEFDAQVNQFKRTLFPYAEPADFEIKGRDLRRGERFFAGMNWPQRERAMLDLAQLIATLPCSLIIVTFDKTRLLDYSRSEEHVYRIAFTRLLDLINASLVQQGESCLLMLDARSDLHSSVQDRRVVDTFKQWHIRQKETPRIVESPWFGFSSFYVGLQIADFCAYLHDFKANEYGESDEKGLVTHLIQNISKKLISPVEIVP